MKKIKFNKASVLLTKKGNRVVELLLTPDSVYKAEEFCENMKNTVYVAEIKQYREKRSLNANSYMWALIEQIAEKMSLPTDIVYKRALVYGGTIYKNNDGTPVTFMITEEQANDMVRKGGRMYTHSKFIGNENGNEVYAIIKGSSEYDSKEMYRLIEEVICMAKELGIDTITENEKQRMMEVYAQKN